MLDIEKLIEKFTKEGLVNEAELQERIKEYEKKSVTKSDLETLGNALIFTFQNDNQLGDLVMSLFFQINDLAMMVLQLQSEMEEIKNA